MQDLGMEVLYNPDKYSVRLQACKIYMALIKWIKNLKRRLWKGQGLREDT